MNRPISLKQWQKIGPQLHSTRTAARMLNVSRVTVYNRIEAGTLGYVTIGGWVFIPQVEIDRLRGVK